MKKIAVLLIAVALCGWAVFSDAKVKTVSVDMGVTDVIADDAVDTTAVIPIDPGVLWRNDDAAVADGEPAMWLHWTYTAAGVDSIAFFVDFYNGTGDLVGTTTQTLDPYTSAAWNVLDLAPGFPPAGVRFRLSNTDAAAAATTAAEAILTYQYDD